MTTSMVGSAERTVLVGRVELCVQAFGVPSDPAVLLVAGTGCSMDWWPPEFCDRLAARGFFVIRYDQRDTGRSTHDPAGRPSYSLPDLVADAVSVLDRFGIATAHWVGFSAGGWVAQLAALDHPARVSSLALLSSRPTGHGPADADLPEVADSLFAAWEAAGEPDWSDASAVLSSLVNGERVLAGSVFDEAAVLAVCERALGRGRDIQASVTNHVIAGQGPRWRERLGSVAVPTVVLHGTLDPMFPLGNGEALAAAIPGARLTVLPGVGHELAPGRWDDYLNAIDQVAGRARNQ